MHTQSRITVMLSLALLVVALLALGGGIASAAPLPPSTACDYSVPGTVTCNLYAKPGALSPLGLSGPSFTVWGYADSAGGAAQVPGPVLIVDQGVTVTVILHNELGVAGAAVTTSLAFEGQSLPFDPAGVAGGGQKSYSFVASDPGTFLYEAGPLPNAQHQVAMGLYGALIVRPSVIPPAGFAGQAYANPVTAFHDEAVLVLSEIDPALNNLATPADFDMRNYKPKYRLINGKAYPNTDPIATVAGNTLLLRYVNAGQEPHTMALLGAYQRFLSLAGVELPHYRSLTSELLGPGQSADALVVVPPIPVGAPLVVRYPLYDASMRLHNNGAAGFGGMLTFLEVPNGPPGGDTSGPATSALALNPPKTGGTTPVAVILSATVSDVASGNSNVVAAEYFVGAPGANGAGCAMTGTFGAPTVNVNATIPLSGATAPCVDLATLPHGSHTFYIHGQDAAGNWGSFNFIVLNLDEAGPMTGGISFTPAVSNGSVAVAIQATGDDSASGNSNVTGAEYFIDPASPPDPTTRGTALNVTTTGPAASLNGTISAGTMGTLAEGRHALYIRSQDALGNWGALALGNLDVDKTGPAASNVAAYPNPNNGTLGVNPVTPSVRVDATLDDLLAGSGGGARSNVAAAEGFIDRGDVPGTGDPGLGSGFPFTPLDGQFNSVSENAYAFIPLTTINALPVGTHTIWVRGRDAAGNWGAAVGTPLTIDKSRPTVTTPVATPNPTNGLAIIILTSTASDVASGNSRIARAEWFRGADPGAGNGTAMSASDGAFDSASEGLTATIDVNGWPEGPNVVNVRARDAAGNWSLIASTSVDVRRWLYFSTFGNTNPPGVAGTADDADIYHWNGAAFSRAFDASAFGLPTGANVDGLVRVDSTHFYVSFSAANTSVPGIGSVQDEDVVYYNDGVWSMYFDGTAVGLGASANLDLDAFDIVGSMLYFSTVGASNPPGVTGTADDADIYAWNGTSFSRVLVASVVGLPAGANVDGYVRIDATHFLLSFSGVTTAVPVIGNVQDEDVVYYNAGAWSVYFDGTLKGLTADNQDVDAFDIP